MQGQANNYDEVCTQVREGTDAAAALVVILRGSKGTGFSVQTKDNLNPLALADLLEVMAGEIRARALH